MLKIRDSHNALVEGAKHNVLVRSTTPLAVPDGEGGLRRMNLTPERAGSGFVPVAGPGQLDLPDEIDGGVEIAGEVRIETDGDDAEGQVVGASVMYANSRPDTDTAVQPTATGVEFWDVLRSADSPEEISYRVKGVSSHASMSLRRVPSGGTEILENGVVTGKLSKAFAIDADGTGVPVEEIVDGDELRLRIAHRDADFAYPIQVDPVLEWYSWEQGVQSYTGWTSGITGDGSRWPAQWIGQWGYLGHGLSIINQWDGPNNYFWDGDRAWFSWAPPGGTYITTGGFAWMDMDLSAQSGLNGAASVCMMAGVADASSGAWQQPAYFGCGGDIFGISTYWSLGAQPRNQMVFGIYMSGAGWRQQYAVNVGHAEMGIVDPTPPTAQRLSPTTGWTTNNQVGIRGTDLNPGNYAGLGIDMLEVDGAQRYYACNGNRSGSPCPYYRDDYFPVAEGNRSVALRSRDPAGTWSAPTYTGLKIDRSRPTLAVTAAPASTQITTESPTVTVRAQDGVLGGTGAQARSGVRNARVYLHSPGDPATAVGTDVTNQATLRTENCRNGQTAVADSCPLTVDYTFVNGPHRARGDYKLRVLAYDQLGQGPSTAEAAAAGSAAGELEIAFKKVDGTPPSTPILLHGNGGYPLGWLDTYNGTVTASSTDPGSGIREFAFVKPHVTGNIADRDPSLVAGTQVECDGTPAKPCPATRVSKQFAYDTSLFKEGVVNPYVYAKDGDQNQSSNAKFAPDIIEGAGLKIDRSPPQIDVGDAFAGYGENGAGKVLTEHQTYRMSIRSTDVGTPAGSEPTSPDEWRSGVEWTKIEVAKNFRYGQAEPDEPFVEIDNDDPRVEGSVRSNLLRCADLHSCDQERSFLIDAATFGEGLHAIRITSRDRVHDGSPGVDARHTAARIVYFYVDFTVPAASVSKPMVDGSDMTDRGSTPWFGATDLVVSGTADDNGAGVREVTVTYPPVVGDGFKMTSRLRADLTEPCKVSDQREDQCPQPFSSSASAPLARYNTGDIADGRDVKVRLHATDASGRVSAETEWLMDIDHRAPVYDEEPFAPSARPSNPGYAFIDWEAPNDPLLSDNSPGSEVQSYDVSTDGGVSWTNTPVSGIQVPEFTGTVALQVKAYDAAGNVSQVYAANVSMGATDPEDEIPLGFSVPTPGDEVIDADQPLSPDRETEAAELFAEPAEEAAEPDALNGGPSARATYPPNGNHNLPYTCNGQWAAIQAQVSGFVIGNCRGGTAVLGYKAYVKSLKQIREDERKNPGSGWPGHPNEGRGWEAVALPSTAAFDGCGWINIHNRLNNVNGTPPSNQCGTSSRRKASYDLVEYIKRYTGSRPAGGDHPNSKKYQGLYIWAPQMKKGSKKRETDGYKYKPEFDNGKVCTAYANINPHKGGFTVRADERMWEVHDDSENIRIRYLAKHRARTENGDLHWWVMTRSLHSSDTDQPWGFVSANCLFSE